MTFAERRFSEDAQDLVAVVKFYFADAQSRWFAEEDGGARVREEINGLARERARADRDADAAKRLEELKRKMGK